MNYCAQCGHKLSGDEHFCPVCGTPVKAGTSAVQAAPAKANLTSAQATPAKAVRPVLNKRILRVVDFFAGKALPFHDADCVSLCGRTSFLPRLPKIYYLLMMVDGECTKKEMQKFTAICKSCRISENDQKAAIVYCEGNVSDDCVQRIVTLNAELKNVTDSLQNDALIKFCDFPDDLQPLYLSILWNLIDLGYADGNFSREEQAVVETLAEAWKAPKDTLAELYDIAETVQLLCRKLAFLQQANLPEEDYLEVKKKLDHEITSQYKSIRSLLNESIRI